MAAASACRATKGVQLIAGPVPSLVRGRPDGLPSLRGNSRPINSWRSARLLRPTHGMVANSRSCARCRSSRVRKPLVTKERAARRVSPRCSHAFNASQYSSNDEALRLMVFDKSPSPRSVKPSHRGAGSVPLDQGGANLSVIQRASYRLVRSAEPPSKPPA
jgi:hypothetical protein